MSTHLSGAQVPVPAQPTTIDLTGRKHVHDWQPHYVDYGRRRIVSNCAAGCGKRRKVYARRCPDCDTGAGLVQRRDGCGNDCFQGYVPEATVPACCCSGPKAGRCDGCANAKRGGNEVHVCAVLTADEIAFATELEFMPVPRTVRSNAGAESTASDMGGR